jgi:hypothetical protein
MVALTKKIKKQRKVHLWRRWLCVADAMVAMAKTKNLKVRLRHRRLCLADAIDPPAPHFWYRIVT